MIYMVHIPGQSPEKCCVVLWTCGGEKRTLKKQTRPGVHIQYLGSHTSLIWFQRRCPHKSHMVPVARPHKSHTRPTSCPHKSHVDVASRPLKSHTRRWSWPQ